jgi:Cytochrome c7 and related cytochrome c/Class III cytochrome C family
MSGHFHPRANTAMRLILFGAVGLVAFVTWGGALIVRSPYETRQDVPREQPVPFSHEHHAGGLGLDCRYCHQTVEVSSFAGIPPTKVCMNCHSEMWAAAPALEPVRESYRTGKSIQWTRVHELPYFVYFDHSIHIHQGIGCSSCHGRVDRMALTWQAEPLTMAWCLDCHRNPEMHVRPRERVFDMNYAPPPDQRALGTRLVKEYGIQGLTNCSTCHR